MTSEWRGGETEGWTQPAYVKRVTRVLFYCCLKQWLMNHLLKHKSVKLLSLLDPYSMCTSCTYTNIQMQTHGYTQKSSPYSHIGKRLNIELMWSQECCCKTRSKNSYSTPHICMHTHTRGYTSHTASLIFCLRLQETISTQFTIQQTHIWTNRQKTKKLLKVQQKSRAAKQHIQTDSDSVFNLASILTL